MFSKLLIANRGEIACRVAVTCARLGIRTVAVYSPADAQAKHVQMCDQAVAIGLAGSASGGNAPQDSYLRWQAVLAAAKATGAQAVHPGYGFLSENAEFAQACADAGLVFVGPPPAAIQAMGLKAESKQLMAKAGVPLVPGYHGANQDATLLRSEADRIGYPVLIKASAGGGGKGMRVVASSADFDAALRSCQREALASFANDAVLIEKYVQRPRHIEMQIFGDAHGHYVHLFERDCSVQRRHQKVLEEAPAPGMTPALREQMGAAAVAAARAVGYQGAGTVEFIVEQSAGGGMQFFFMEMNTRLQVEHPVTEAITGLDLVEWQLRVACGEPLPMQQSQLHINGHAIEARICAENPAHDFLPSTGTLQVYTKPAHAAFTRAALRFDDGVRQGDAITPYYDPMIGKLIVHGTSRDDALAQLSTALGQTHIVGLHTNVQFLRRVVHSAAFAQAQLDTALIQREAAQLFAPDAVGMVQAVASALAQLLVAERRVHSAEPFNQRDGWRAFGTHTRSFAFERGGDTAVAQLHYLHDGALHLHICAGGEASEGVFSCAAMPTSSALSVHFAQQHWQANCYAVSVPNGQETHVFTAQAATKIIVIDPFYQSAAQASAAGSLTAPMPGKLLSFNVEVGDVVQAGQALAVMEAMKMEHTIAAPGSGTVAELLYAAGDQVAEGAALLRLVD
jgi:3-methylcrotonyl-CoA carboxylase alpha subunit